jgi:hypothetical protein
MIGQEVNSPAQKLLRFAHNRTQGCEMLMKVTGARLSVCGSQEEIIATFKKFVCPVKAREIFMTNYDQKIRAMTEDERAAFITKGGELIDISCVMISKGYTAHYALQYLQRSCRGFSCR